MSDEIDWKSEIAAYDASAALAEMRIMWLRLGRRIASIVENSDDWMDDRNAADEVMGWASRAEACLWRATGDADAIDANLFVPELRARGATVTTNAGGCPEEGE